jgi:hypothetical protein
MQQSFLEILEMYAMLFLKVPKCIEMFLEISERRVVSFVGNFI